MVAQGQQTEAQSESQLPGGGFLLWPAGSRDIFTPERLSEDQRAFYRTAVDFVDSKVAPHHQALEEKQEGLMMKLVREAAEVGLHMIEIPEAYDGMGLDKTTSCLVSEALAREGSFSVSMGAHNGIGMLPLIFYGSEELKQEWLPKFATAEKIGAYALTEPGSGSDALAAKTTAVLSDDGKEWVLNGSKMWITNAKWADVVTVFAKVDGDKFSAFLVPTNVDGFSVGREEPKMGIRGSSTCALSLDNVRIPKANLLGEVGRGHKIAFNILNIGRLRLGVAVMGGAKKTLGLAAQYANERKQFNTPLSGFPIIQQKLADMATAIYQTEAAAYRTTGAVDQAMESVAKSDPDHAKKLVLAIEEYNIEASIMKVAGSEALDFVADEAVQIHGGYGYSEEYEVECAYRDSRINRIFEGTNEINRMLVPGTLLKRAMKGQLDLMSCFGSIADAQDLSDGPLLEERRLADATRRLAVHCLGTAATRLMQKLSDEQEILCLLADMCIDTYLVDTSVRRAMQAIDEAPAATHELHQMFATISAQELYERATHRARRIMIELAGDEDPAGLLDGLSAFTCKAEKPLVSMKRKIAQAVSEAGGYPLLY